MLYNDGMKIYFYTLGCKVNSYETEAMKELFKSNGALIETLKPENADVIVVNSCTVTSESDRKTRQAVRRFKRINPTACVVLTGCMPQAYPEKAMDLIQADIVAGNKDHYALLKMVNEYIAKRDRAVYIPKHEKGDSFEDMPIADFDGRTRAVIKIQDGCDRYCSYCIIPTSRGRSRSRQIDNLSSELDKIKDAGFKEVVLVGINLCCYGLDIGKTFTDAIELACQKGFERVRIGSLEFDNISDEAINRMSKLDNFCPQFHISLQSGCDSTLKRMNRHYTTAEYKALCEKLRSKFDDATITTDLMVGFAEETEEDFEASLKFVREIGFEKVHVFPYSVRIGTKAAGMRQVEPEVKNERTHRALKLSEQLRENFLRMQIGKIVEVLVETYDEKTGLFSGYTKNYTPVSFPCRVDDNPDENKMNNEILSVKITDVDMERDCCIGVLTD